MTKKILVCCGTGCLANGSQAVVDQFCLETKEMDVDVIPEIKKTGCNGFCENGPMVTIMPDHVTYYKVRPKDVPEILAGLGKEPASSIPDVSRIIWMRGGMPD